MAKTNQFDMRIQELEAAIERLRERQRKGWKYRRTWIKATRVVGHRRAGHWAMMPVSKKAGK